VWSNPFVEYNPGDANRAPIMGQSYFATRGQWWLGPTPDSQNIYQDDLAVIARTGFGGNGFGYRADDHPGDPLAAADALTVNPDMTITGKGVIEHSDDADLFSFTTPGGPASIIADVAPFAPMLDLSLGLYDENGNPIATAATSSLGERLDLTLAPGTYKVGVSSAGAYGDLGQYSISGFIPEPATAILGSVLSLSAGLSRRRRARRRA
jgi:hypothetical protein